jgi:hypothetical protein
VDKGVDKMWKNEKTVEKVMPGLSFPQRSTEIHRPGCGKAA